MFNNWRRSLYFGLMCGIFSVDVAVGFYLFFDYENPPTPQKEIFLMIAESFIFSTIIGYLADVFFYGEAVEQERE